jgi:CheY-like chemotaxis protein
VVGALSGDEGIRKAKEIHPFAITLDILMPHKDGWAVLKELKAEPETRDIPIIVVSMIEDKQRGFSLGAFDYLLKPIEKGTIKGALQRITAHSAKRVLDVDDDRDAIGLVTQILQDEGHSVLAASNGSEALHTLEATQVDIILLDLVMPEMDGFEVIQRVKENSMLKDIPVIVLTGKDLTEMDYGALQQSVIRIIQKSGVSAEALITEVRDILRTHEIQAEESHIHEKGAGG